MSKPSAECLEVVLSIMEKNVPFESFGLSGHPKHRENLLG
jgi:hypothetical protein